MKNGDFFSLSEMKTITNQTPIAPKTFSYLESAKRDLTASNGKGSRGDSTSCISEAHIAHRKHILGD